VLAGADFAELFMGSTETFNCQSPVQLIIDDEIASNASRIAQGIEVNEDTLSVNVISKTGHLGNFLKQKETLRQFKKEHLAPKLSDRATRQQWTASGSRDTNLRARERVVRLLESHVPEPFEPDARKRIDRLLSEYSKEYGLSMLVRPFH
jgi:trimethylamine--corrinoid protein Co-methyltransferase